MDCGSESAMTTKRSIFVISYVPAMTPGTLNTYTQFLVQFSDILFNHEVSVLSS